MGNSGISAAMTALLVLQAFHVLFLALHDWVPLGRLSNVAAVREANPGGKVLMASVISTTPYAFALAASLHYWDKRFPGWLMIYLWVSYTFLFIGELEAWWFPYFFGWKAERAERYQAMFGGTYSFQKVALVAAGEDVAPAGRAVVGQKGTRDCSGILIPYYWPGEPSSFNYRVRRDNPELIEAQKSSFSFNTGKRMSKSGRPTKKHRRDLEDFL